MKDDLNCNDIGKLATGDKRCKKNFSPEDFVEENVTVKRGRI